MHGSMLGQGTVLVESRGLSKKGKKPYTHIVTLAIHSFNNLLSPPRIVLQAQLSS